MIRFRRLRSSRSRAFPAACCCACLAALSAAAPAQAQLSNLDQGTFIDGLARRGLSDLLLHLIETEPPKDPVVAAQVQIARLLIRSTDPGLTHEQQKQAIVDLVAVTRKLIGEHPDHEQRPVWQTDLAERVLDVMFNFAGDYAGQFYEFGLTTVEQKRMFESQVADVFVQLSDADIRFRQLEDDLSRDEERRRAMTHSGQWERLFEEYWKGKNKYYLALAAYDTALLPDSHAYYQHLGDGRVPLQKKTPQEERRRLLELAIRTADPFVSEANVQYGPQVRMTALALIGRAQLRLGHLDQALATLESVLSQRHEDLTDLFAALAKAWALHIKSQTGGAEEWLAALDRHQAVRAVPSPLLRLLVKDELHRVLLDRAVGAPEAQRDRAVAEAYQPYFDLIAQLRSDADPNVAALAPQLENYIYLRWEANADSGADVSKLPPAVIMGMGSAARGEGERLRVQAEQALKEGEKARAEELIGQATPKLHRAMELLGPLVKRDDLAPPVRARAMYNLGLAAYFSDPNDLNAVLAAAILWTRLADELPEQPESEKAIENATQQLSRIYFQTPGADGYKPALDRAMEVLFSKFPTIRFADDFRLTYAANVLMPSDRYDQAVAVLAGIPFKHVSYFEGRREMLYSLQALYQRAAEGRKKADERRRVLDLGDQLLKEADAGMFDPDAQRAATAVNAAGHARMVLAEMAVDEADLTKALEYLDGFEDKFAADKDLVTKGAAKRIAVLIAAGRADEAGDEAAKMMQRFPDAAAGVINDVVTKLQQRIDLWRKQAAEVADPRKRDQLLDKARSLAAVQVKQATILEDWALRQNYDAADMLPFRLIVVKALVLAEQGDQAVQRAEKLRADFPTDATVIHLMAEALFVRGLPDADEPNLVKAAGYYDLLIGGLGVDDKGRYPDLYWNAWMRRLQIMEALDQYTQDIPIRVSNLLRTDPNLGGEPYKSELLRLRNKYNIRRKGPGESPQPETE